MEKIAQRSWGWKISWEKSVVISQHNIHMSGCISPGFLRSSTGNQRTIHWVGLEKKMERSCQSTLPPWGHLPLDQVVQSFIQMHFEHFQGWHTHTFCGKLSPVPHYPHREAFQKLPRTSSGKQHHTIPTPSLGFFLGLPDTRYAHKATFPLVWWFFLK